MNLHYFHSFDLKYFVFLLVLISFSGLAFAETEYIDTFSTPDFEIYKLKEQKYEFFIPYSITNSKINNITMDCPSRSMVIDIEPPKEGGVFTIVIPRSLMDSKFGNENDNFFILADGEEIDYTEIKTDQEARSIKFHISANISTIEIIVTVVISHSNDPLKIAPCGEGGIEESSYYRLLPPLAQFKSGITPKDVVCKQGLELVMKKSNNQPICIKGTSVRTLTLRNFIPEYVGSLGGEIPAKLSNENQTNSMPLTLFPATPQIVTLPDTTKKNKPDTTLIPINKINQLTITNSDSTNGQKTHLAQLSINSATLYTKDIENLPIKPGFDTVVFDYTIQSKDHDVYYAMLDFELQFGSKKYPVLLSGNDFSELLLPNEKKNSFFAMQVDIDAKQIILNIKDATTKRTLWIVPLDLTNYKIKCNTGCLVQENEN